MTSLSSDEKRLKETLKAAIVEVLEERRDLLHDAVAEALEDIGLGRAIEEDLQTAPASREEVFAVLQTP